jgi:hypothetical protein
MLGLAFVILCAPATRDPPFSKLYFKLFYFGHLLLGSIGYALAGAASQTFPAGANSQTKFASRMLLALAMDPLIGIFYTIAEGLTPNRPRMWTGLWLFSGAFMVVSLIAVAVTSSQGVGEFDTAMVVYGLVTLAAEITWLAVVCRQPSLAAVAKAIAGAGLLAALVVLAYMQPLCGAAGAASCYAACPLPQSFSHQAVAAVIAALSYLLLIGANLAQPDLMIAPPFFAGIVHSKEESKGMSA